jgi:hypothetical protein
MVFPFLLQIYYICYTIVSSILEYSAMLKYSDVSNKTSYLLIINR